MKEERLKGLVYHSLRGFTYISITFTIIYFFIFVETDLENTSKLKADTYNLV